MWFDFTEIPDEGLDIEFSEPPHAVFLKAEGFTIVGSLEVKGRLNKLDRDVLVRAELKTTVELSCARCIEPVSMPVSSRLELEYRLKDKAPRGDESELRDEDVEVYYYTKSRIDLGDAIGDQILLALPMKPLCTDSCKGLCSRCGANLNRGRCKCPEEEVDPRLIILQALKKEREDSR